ncbi:MAG TPA: PIN domain-containing protein [Thermomicrobiales bacterium]|nr:PIN domain-containing protein [Thermomicrobiales bacterium]
MHESREPIGSVVDSNVFVSGLILQRSKPFELLNAWRRQAFVLHMADEQRGVLRAVLSRPELIAAYQVTQEDRDRLFSLLDTDDVHILAAAFGGKADYLVTGDRKHLLPLAGRPELGALQIVTVTEFLLVLAEQAAGL